MNCTPAIARLGQNRFFFILPEYLYKPEIDINERTSECRLTKQRCYEATRANLFPRELKPKYLIHFTSFPD